MVCCCGTITFVNPTDSGLLNFYNPQFIDDVDGDTYPDILVTNGGIIPLLYGSLIDRLVI